MRWAHLEFTPINIALTIPKRKTEESRKLALVDVLSKASRRGDGSKLLKLFAAYSFGGGSVSNTITARLDNVTNELYRYHLNY